MKITVHERKKTNDIDSVKFSIEGINFEIANELRRIMLSEIPTMAITEVIFMENQTPLYDEMIAHRLGLIPLTTDLTNYNLPKECSCQNQRCTLCQTTFTLSVKSGNEPMVVKAKDLIPSDPKIRPVNEDTIIAKLGPNSRLELEAFAQLSIGKEHAKFQCVSTVGYKPFPDITIDTKICKSCTHDFAASKKCHMNLYRISDIPELIPEYYIKCTLCRACEIYCPNKAIKVDYKKDTFMFAIEGTGALSISEILNQALKIFDEKFTEFIDKVDKIEIEGLS